MSECCDYLKLHRISIIPTESKGQEVSIKKKKRNIWKKTLSIWSIYVYNLFISFELFFSSGCWWKLRAFFIYNTISVHLFAVSSAAYNLVNCPRFKQVIYCTFKFISCINFHFYIHPLILTVLIQNVHSDIVST